MTVQHGHDAPYRVQRPPSLQLTTLRPDEISRYQSEISPKRRFAWWDLGAWIVALSIFSFPIAGLLGALLGIQDDALSLISRIAPLTCAAALLLKRGIAGRLTAPSFYLTLFFAVYSARLIFDSIYGENVDGAIVALKFFSVTSLLPVAAAIMIIPSDWRETETLVAGLFLATIFLAISYYLVATGNFLILGQEEGTLLGEDGTRVSFERLNAILFGHASVSAVCVSLCVLLTDSGRKMKIWAAIVTIASAAMAYQAASRGPLVALAMVAVLIIFSSGKSRWLLLALAILTVIGSLFSLMDFSGLLDRTRFTTVGEDAGSLERFQLIIDAFSDFWNSPIYGNGFEVSGGGGYPHNVLVEVFMATGVIGGTILLLALVPVFIKAYQSSKQSLNLGSMLFVQYFVGYQFSGSLWGAYLMWLGMAMVTHNLVGQKLSIWRKKPNTGKSASFQ